MSRRFMTYTGACTLLASAAVVAAIPAPPLDAPAAPSSDTTPPVNDPLTFTPDSPVAPPHVRADARLDGAASNTLAPAAGGDARLAGPTGEDCANAFIIPSIPFSTTGSTIGMMDDYEIICSSVGLGGPDAVYRFDATENIVVNISLCQNSDFDTRLYVFEDLCDEPSVIACNENQCPTPSFANPNVSQVFDVQLFAGSSYFIVVDGFNGVASGNYTLDITLDVPPCPEESTFVQEHSMPDQEWRFGTSDAAQTTARAETYSVEGLICGVRWWGLQLFNDGAQFLACEEDPVSFTVNFHEDDAGAPGAIACTFDAVLSPTPTGIYYSGFQLVEFNLDLSADGCCDLTTGWISIIGGTDAKTDDPDCWYLWASSGNEDDPDTDSAVDDGFGWGNETYDLSFCLTTGEPVEPCAGDVAGVSPGTVDVEDLLAVLGTWGACPDPCPPNCDADVVSDCAVDVQDLLEVLGNWGPCPEVCPPCPADAVEDCAVDVQDLLLVLGDWGPCPGPCPPNCEADVVADCVVDVQDLLLVLGDWGPCEE